MNATLTIGEIAAALKTRLRVIEEELDASPLGKERARLRTALEALEHVEATPEAKLAQRAAEIRASKTARKASGQAHSSTRARKSTAGRTTTRAQDMLADIGAHPNSTIREVAERLKVKPEQFHRIAAQLVADKDLEKFPQGPSKAARYRVAR